MSRTAAGRSLNSALIVVAVSGLLLGGIQLALVLPGSEGGWPVALFTIDFWVYLAAGILAWWRRPSNRIGFLIIIGGFAVFAGGLSNSEIPPLIIVGAVCATVILALAVHLLHAFPSGRLRGTASRVTVVTGYFVTTVLQVPIYLFAGESLPGFPVLDRPDLLQAGVWLQRGGVAAVVVATSVILIGRLRRADAEHRRVLVPLFVYGMGAILFVLLSPTVLQPLLGLSPLVRAIVQLVLIGGIPIAFVLGTLRGGFARTGELEELGGWLGSGPGTRSALTAALARTLGDATLQVVFWVAERRVFVDSAGRPAALPAPSSDRAAIEIRVGDRLVGAIVYDSGLIADPELVRTAGRVLAIAVDRERLTAELLASQRALRRSRMRLVEAADDERRRIAQDLHDGLQVQLVLLALEAQQLANAPDAGSGTRQDATELRKGIDAAAGDLRQLVHAVMPSSLIERGLSAATEDLADRMPMPTTLDLRVADGTLPASIERTAYFILAEGLTNAVKHSGAHSVLVRLVRDGETLLIEVSDDGVGGATVGRGSGLRGIADRVDVAGGTLRLESDRDSGTRLLVQLPCAS